MKDVVFLGELLRSLEDTGEVYIGNDKDGNPISERPDGNRSVYTQDSSHPLGFKRNAFMGGEQPQVVD